MKCFILSSMLLFCSAFLYGQSTEREALKKVVDGFLLAIKNNDEAAAKSLIAENYELAGGLYCIKNKEQRVACLKSGQIKYELKVPLATKNFAVYGNQADIRLNTSAKYSACSQDGKEQTDEDCPVLLSFVLKEGNWKIASECIGGSCLH